MAALSADELILQAERAERAGARADAEAAWSALIRANPEHPRALFAAARRRLEQNDPAGALPLLLQAEARDTSYAELPFCTATAHRLLGDDIAAVTALDRALSIDPYFFAALLAKGTLYEKLGHPKPAAHIYKNALRIAPLEDRLPASQRAALNRAKEVVQAYGESLRDHVLQRTASAAAQLGADASRFYESIDILAGLKQRQVQDPLLFYYPRLPAITFYDRALFPWYAELEAATPAICAELETVMRHEWNRFAPYIQKAPEAPLNQWKDLNHSANWSTLFLWRDGKRYGEVCDLCPKTASLLSHLPMAEQAGLAPTAMFSVLSPRTRIPPHTGSTNIRLITHLPLIMPPNCGFRVGNESREWRMGEAWTFDDTIEHEAWNDSDEMRVILIFDIWNPLLGVEERVATTKILHALQEFDTLP